MKFIDLHCDTIGEKVAASGGKIKLRRNNCHIDLEKMTEAGSVAQMFAIFIPTHHVAEHSNVTLSPMEYFQRAYTFYLKELKENNDIIEPAHNYEDIIKNQASNKISSILTVEDGVLIGENLDSILKLYKKGVRLITLTWNYENSLAYPNSRDAEIMSKGLKSFGVEAIKYMNDIGIIVDVSHLSDGGFYDVVKYSKLPFVASHSCARSLNNHPRNLTDEMLKLIGNTGSVCGINFASQFLANESAKYTKVDDIVRHALHIKNTAGIEAIALGSDFDGISSELEFTDYTGMVKIAEALSKHFTESEVDKICCKNALRVIKDSMK
ncbi:MAG: hypothetical protein K0R54_4015 [Clostridiaceae bacterium]|jgi:membrane dipeptidase|nr:hypothetical protein [Clostridiaceae bacterium]